MPKEQLRVYANPRLHLDAAGNPCCVVRRVEDPRQFVGARQVVRDTSNIAVVGNLTGIVGTESHEVQWEFDEGVQTIPFSNGEERAYYGQCIREGALVLADEADAIKWGIARWVGTGADAKQAIVPCGKHALAGATREPKPARADKKESV